MKPAIHVRIATWVLRSQRGLCQRCADPLPPFYRLKTCPECLRIRRIKALHYKAQLQLPPTSTPPQP